MTTSTPHVTDRLLLERQAARESNARTYPRGLPFAIARAEGAEITSVDGKRYLDFCAGAGVLALGHNHPDVVAAVKAQLDEVVHTLDIPTPTRDEFVSELLGILPGNLGETMRVHVCGPTGADAVEAAIKLCKRATGRSTVVAFQGSYHGMTAGALALTSLREVKERIPALMPEVHFAPYSYCGRCPLKLNRASCDSACASMLETMLEDTHSGVNAPAAVIAELVQGEGGSIVPRADFVTRAVAATKRAGTPFIADEVQAGMGRTGKWWAFEHYDVEPDVIVTSKALGGAGLPIAAILYRRDLDVWEPGTHIGTFRGHQLALAAGTAGIRVMKKEGVLDNARERGAQLLEGLSSLKSEWVHEARGLGLMLGLELADPHTGMPATELAVALRTECFERGLVVELGGRADATLRLLPPLIISEAQATRALDIIREGLKAAERRVCPPRATMVAGPAPVA